LKFARVEVLTAMNVHVVILWIATPCSLVVAYQGFGGPFCLHLLDCDTMYYVASIFTSPWRWSNMALRNVDILPHHYMAPQPRRQGFESQFYYTDYTL